MKVQCHECHEISEVPVTVSQILAWRNGELIQRAMPNLTDDQRELILTQTCGKCFDSMFSEEDFSNSEEIEEAAF